MKRRIHMIDFKKELSQHMEMMRMHQQEIEAAGGHIFKLSTTERQEFMECRKRWDYGSLSRQAIERKMPSAALWFGTSIHWALEQWYSGMDAQEVIPAWQQWIENYLKDLPEEDLLLQESKINEMKDLGAKMLEGYISWSKFADNKESTGFKNVLATEQEFAVQIPTQNGPLQVKDKDGHIWEPWLVGRWDMIVEDFNGKPWILDHKTSKDKVNAEMLLWDDQMTVYLWAAFQIFGIPFEGCMYNVLRKKIPTVPYLLKAGGLTKAKSIDTTYDTYFKAILDNQLNPDDYQDILEYLITKPNTFFERVKLSRNLHELQTTETYLRQQALDMMCTPSIYPNFTRDCSWKCDYISLCLGEQKGDDVDFLRKQSFRKRVTPEESIYQRGEDVE